MRFYSLALFLVLGCLPFASANAQESRLQEFNCAVMLPTGLRWSTPAAPNSMVKAIAQTTDGTAAVSLSVVALPSPNMKLDGGFIEAFERGYFPAGQSKKTSGKPLIYQGIPAYRATGVFYVNGNTVQRAMVLIIADGRVYHLSATKLGASPLDDADLRAAMNSFHFLNPPRA